MPDPDFWGTRVDKLTLPDLETLVTGGVKREKSTLDFKRFGPPEKLVDAEGIGRDICAFANAMGGRIVLGAIEDNADGLDRFAGVEMGGLRSVRASIRNATHAVQPPPLVTWQEITLTDGRIVIVVEIRPGVGGPHQHKGTYLLRSADGTVPMPHSTVVLSVLATHGDNGREFGIVHPLDRVGQGLIASSYPFGEARPGYYLGVELRSRYPLRSPLCDPLGDEADQVVGLCKADGFETSKKRQGVWAERRQDGQVDRRLRVLFAGLADGATYVGSGHLERSEAVLTRMFERQIRLLARLLSSWNPALVVEVRVGLWANGGSDMRLMVTKKDEFDADHPLGSIPAQVMFQEELVEEQPVSELLEAGTVEGLALRAFGLLSLEMQPVSRGP